MLRRDKQLAAQLAVSNGSILARPALRRYRGGANRQASPPRKLGIPTFPALALNNASVPKLRRYASPGRAA